MTTGVPYQGDEVIKEEELSPKVKRIAKEALPPMACDPSSESAGEEEIDDDEDWVYPPVQTGLRYERYLRTSKPLADGTNSIKLLAQPSFALKPMMEEAVIPSKTTMSTYACYVRKVTSFIACWSGCIPMRISRQYRRKDDSEWIRLYNYCISEANLKNAHLFLKAKDLAALCGVLSNVEEIQPIIKKLTSQRFLNSAASSSSGSTEVSSGVRLASTGLFTDFDIVRTSNARNRINMQSALGDQFAWANIHHVSVEDKGEKSDCRCLEVIAIASDFVDNLSKRSDEVKAGASIHIWLSFADFVFWSRDGVNSRFSFDETRVKDIVLALSKLICNSFAPVFVNLCSCSDFFHGDMQMEKVVKRVAAELSKVGVPVTHNPAMWSECANFINYKREAINPKSTDSHSSVGEQWDSFAAFACIDKFLFREKMLLACVVGDDTINSFEGSLEDVPMDGVLTKLPSEMTLTEPAAQCERISTDTLRKRKTVNPLTNVDFDAVNPKTMYKDDRFWYCVPIKSTSSTEGYHQDNPRKMTMCSQCCANKISGKGFDEFDENAKYCPNCASNSCRKFYFNEAIPNRKLSFDGWRLLSSMKRN